MLRVYWRYVSTGAPDPDDNHVLLKDEVDIDGIGVSHELPVFNMRHVLSGVTLVILPVLGISLQQHRSALL